MVEIGDTVIFEEQRSDETHYFIPQMTGIIRDLRNDEALVEFISGPRDGEQIVFPVNCFDDPG